VLLNDLFWSLSVVAINMVFGRNGTDNYAAMTDRRTIENLVFVFFIATATTCNGDPGWQGCPPGRIEEWQA
jgi:Na+-driven multidrug efflux pump